MQSFQMKSQEKINALIVDDEEEIRTLLSEFLSKDSYDCKVAESGENALEIIQKNSLDVVVSDIKMGGMDGLELMKKARKSHPDLPFIIVTGFDREYSYSEIIDQGASDFLTKPIQLEVLKARTDKAVLLSRKQKELHETLEKLKESEERLKSFYSATFEGIVITEQGKIIDVNSRFTELFGYERDELIGMDA